MVWRSVVIALVFHLVLSGSGWAEEPAPHRGEAHRRQLIGLIGT